MSLEDKIMGIIKAADIRAGVAVWHIESGEQVDVNGDEPFRWPAPSRFPY